MNSEEHHDHQDDHSDHENEEPTQQPEHEEENGKEEEGSQIKTKEQLLEASADAEKKLTIIVRSEGMRRQISFSIRKLKEGCTLTIYGYGPELEKAVRMAEILKSRVGSLH